MATTVEATTRGQTTATGEQARTLVPGPDQRCSLARPSRCVIAWRCRGWFVLASGKRKEQFAARSLNQARAAAEAGNLPLASSELQRLIETYKGTDAASEAVITLNQVRMVNGQSELAAVGLREFSPASPPAKYLAPAYGLLGAALENSKRWAEAADAFTQASKPPIWSTSRPTTWWTRARAFRRGGEAGGGGQGISDGDREVSGDARA